MSSAANKYMPGIYWFPSMVCVFPEPVCPYAKHVTLAPANAAVTRGKTISL
jgi:hypothetical protein